MRLLAGSNHSYRNDSKHTLYWQSLVSGRNLPCRSSKCPLTTLLRLKHIWHQWQSAYHLLTRRHMVFRRSSNVALHAFLNGANFSVLKCMRWLKLIRGSILAHKFTSSSSSLAEKGFKCVHDFSQRWQSFNSMWNQKRRRRRKERTHSLYTLADF